MAKMSAVVLIVIASMIMIPIPEAFASEDDAEDGLLVDYGNGRYDWYALEQGQTVRDALLNTLEANSVEIGFADEYGTIGIASVNGIVAQTIGGVGTSTCSWRIYSWNDVTWEFLTDDASDRYTGGSLAIGYYPHDTILPASNPDCRDVWTSFKGDSSSSGVSDSFGPERVATPLEWYSTYPGSVDSTILYADNLIYHTASGKYGSSGMDGFARLYCLDPSNHETVWEVGYSDSGNIEIVTPCIVGDLILLPSGNWHMYCIDRFTGEAVAELLPEGDDADMCEGLRALEYEVRLDSPTVSDDRIHSNAGVTNIVYDTGAVYFCTADGAVRCYTIDRDHGFREMWTTVPEEDYRGCFYYYPPVITGPSHDRIVVSGNCRGSVIALDADDGSVVWCKKVQSSSGEYANYISSVSACPDGRILISYDCPTSGGLMLVNSSNGSLVWQKGIDCNHPTVFNDRFYGYVSHQPNGEQGIVDSRTGETREIASGYYSFWLSDCSMCWSQDTESQCKGSMTYCDGYLYSIDYSPGTEGAYGGWVWCLDSDTGAVRWKAKVAPYSGVAYSMCTPTVIDGRVLVGNDYGAIYILSETPSKTHDSSSNIGYESNGLLHWSWLTMFGVSAVVMIAAIILYRK